MKRRLISILLCVAIIGMLAACSLDSIGQVVKAAEDVSNALENNNTQEAINQLMGYLGEDYEDYSDSEAVGEYPYNVNPSSPNLSADEIPEYWGSPYITINDNVPFFDESDFTTEPFEYYSELDSLGRCGVAYANVCQELMPTEERGDISRVHPSGWHSGNDPASWNRCHLIGFQLAGENDNELNLVTGSRYMNVDGMLPFENEIAEYVRVYDGHVLYRVTPIYDGDDLVCQGVLMEADSGPEPNSDVEFCVFCYNVAPGVIIDYTTGDSWYTE